MGQMEVLRWLQKNKKKQFTAPEIINFTGVSPQAVYSALRRLRRTGEVGFEVQPVKFGHIQRKYFSIEDSEIVLKQPRSKSNSISSTNLDHYIKVEDALRNGFVQVQQLKNLYRSCLFQANYKQYTRRDVIDDLWLKIKKEVESNGDNES